MEGGLESGLAGLAPSAKVVAIPVPAQEGVKVEISRAASAMSALIVTMTEDAGEPGLIRGR